MTGVDYSGIGILISAVFAGLAGLIAAWNQRTVRDIHTKIDTNGDTRNLGEIATDIAKTVGSPVPDVAPHDQPKP